MLYIINCISYHGYLYIYIAVVSMSRVIQKIKILTRRGNLGLEVLHVFDGHFDYFGFFNSTSTFFHIFGWYEPRQIGQAIIHSIASPFFYYTMRHRVLQDNKKHYRQCAVCSYFSSMYNIIILLRNASRCTEKSEFFSYENYIVLSDLNIRRQFESIMITFSTLRETY